MEETKGITRKVLEEVCRWLTEHPGACPADFVPCSRIPDCDYEKSLDAPDGYTCQVTRGEAERWRCWSEFLLSQMEET